VSDGLRALASVASAKEDESARAHADVLRAEERARASWQDALERLAEAERVLRAADDTGMSAAERVGAEAHRAKLRERVVAAKQLASSRQLVHERAAGAVEASRASLGIAHGEHRMVRDRLERQDGLVRASRARREDDETDDLAGRKRD